MATPLALTMGWIAVAAAAPNEEWSCRALSSTDGYQCPTIECVLTFGAHLGVRNDMPVADLLEALCAASKDGAISDLAVVEFGVETPGMKGVKINDNLCSPKIDHSSYLGLIVAPGTEEDAGGIISRVVIDIQNSKATRIVREVRTAKCYWERGL